MNYYKLGKRIKNIRKANSLTQEMLAELVGLSVQHISHIENARTKLSVESLTKISNALSVSIDEIMCDNLVESKCIFINDISDLLSDCNSDELKILTQTITSLKKILRESNTEIYSTKYSKKENYFENSNM